MPHLDKLILALVLFSTLFIGGCSDKPILGFSDSPFSKSTNFTPKDTFKKGEKINYFVYNPQGFKTRLIKIQIFAREDYEKSEFGGYKYLYNKTVELTNKKYYQNSYIINKKGQYFFQVFEFTNLQEPIAMGIIRVED